MGYHRSTDASKVSGTTDEGEGTGAAETGSRKVVELVYDNTEDPGQK